MSALRWLSPPLKMQHRSSQAPPLRLFAFPHAGGSASVFAGWRGKLPSGVELAAVQYPGRESRWGDPGYPSLSAMVAALTAELLPLLSGSFVFLGHSYGSLVAFELARSLLKEGAPLPAKLVLSGARAPHLPPRERIHSLPDAELWNKVSAYGGIPDDPGGSDSRRLSDLMDTMLPAIRHDFTLFENHQFEETAPLPLPLILYGGLQDPAVPLPDLQAWGKHTNAAVRRQLFGGDHFFLYDSDAVLADLSLELSSLVVPTL